MIIKQEAEDFQVEEIIELDQTPGDYLYVKLIKKNWNTLDLIKRLQEFLKCKPSQIGYAGIKDKRAITIQYLSLYKIKKEQLASFTLPDVQIMSLHYGSKPIYTGSLEGNAFKIRCSESPIKISFVENYFGEQRFSKNNADIGKDLIKKNYKEACAKIKHEDLQNYLQQHPTDYIGALKKINKKVLTLYLHALQSKWWNEVSTAYLKNNYADYIEHEGLVFVQEKKEDISIPILSFDTEFTNKEIEQLYNQILQREQLTKRDFILRSFPEILPTSQERTLFIEVNNCEVNGNLISFRLPKGSYATIVIKKIEAMKVPNL